MDETISKQLIPMFSKKSFTIIAITAIVSFVIYHYLPYETNVKKALCLLFFIAVMWLSEAIHITITALLIPVLAIIIGVGSVDKNGVFTALNIKKALAGFSDPMIYVFFGGFALATALHTQRLDKKIAMKIISLSKNNLKIATFAIFVITAFLSMWISNTATVAMMLPLALGIIRSLNKNDQETFVFILLGIAYSASIGGLGTIVGSPPNAIVSVALGYSFFDWMKVGIPFLLIFFPGMVVILYVCLRPNLNQKVKVDIEEIEWNKSRIITACLFVIIALMWIFSKQLSQISGIKISDALVAIIAAICVVVLGLTSWDEVSKNTEWGVLLLFGGGITLSTILKDSGASLVLGNEIARIFQGAPILLVIFMISLFVTTLTEFTSNTASAALLVPVFAAVSQPLGIPKEVLSIIIGIGASCAFIMPVATPPNAIVFGTGFVKQKYMLKCGALLSIFCSISLTLVSYFYFLKF